MNVMISKISIAVRKPVIRAVNKPTPVTYIGAGQLSQIPNILKNAGVQKVLMLTDGQLMSLGVITPIINALVEAQIAYTLFDEVTSDPTFSVVDRACTQALGCDSLLAIGGGSVIDTAKAVGASMSRNKPAKALVGMFKVRQTLPFFIAVPTTAGTGSETTVAAVISDDVTHLKYQLLDPVLVPHVAILDPEITYGLPAFPTAFTALDALTHALEAYVCTYASAETDRYAEMAIRLIFNALPVVLQEPQNTIARESLLTASFYAGMAFTRTYVGYVHAFAHTIGAKYGVPHGLANAILLPHIMSDFNASNPKPFAKIADMLELCSPVQSEAVRGRAFIDALFELNRESGIPQTFKALKKDDFDAIIKIAFKECHGIYPVPRYYTFQSASVLLSKVCPET